MSTAAPNRNPRVGDRREAIRADPAHLEIVRERARRARRRRLVPLLSAATVASSLLAIVLGHSYVAQEQVKLAATEAAVTAAQVQHHQEMVSVAHLENPSRVLRSAEATLHVVTPAQVHQVPYVTLGVALPPPSLGTATSSTTASTTPGT